MLIVIKQHGDRAQDARRARRNRFAARPHYHWDFDLPGSRRRADDVVGAHAGEADGWVPGPLVFVLLKSVALVALIVVTGMVSCRGFDQIVRSRSRELFLLTIIVLCLGIAWLTSLTGLSLALGAFIAGLVISESEYSHQAMAEVLPFRDSFNS